MSKTDKWFCFHKLNESEFYVALYLKRVEIRCSFSLLFSCHFFPPVYSPSDFCLGTLSNIWIYTFSSFHPIPCFDHFFHLGLCFSLFTRFPFVSHPYSSFSSFRFYHSVFHSLPPVLSVYVLLFFFPAHKDGVNNGGDKLTLPLLCPSRGTKELDTLKWNWRSGLFWGVPAYATLCVCMSLSASIYLAISVSIYWTASCSLCACLILRVHRHFSSLISCCLIILCYFHLYLFVYYHY